LSVSSSALILRAVLAAFEPQSATERDDVERLRQLDDPWPRNSLLHVTGSAVVVHPPTRRVLLRWHDRMQAWLQVGGHADRGEVDPFSIALREAREETGLMDLAPWPDARILQVAVVPVPPGKGEPEHHHGDIRYGLQTAQPENVIAESDSAALMWLEIDDAIHKVGWDNLRVCLRRIAQLLEDLSS
jgi:8-oxo-dGTP pyrophosphatase MutT (NUDIX family)